MVNQRLLHLHNSVVRLVHESWNSKFRNKQIGVKDRNLSYQILTKQMQDAEKLPKIELTYPPRFMDLCFSLPNKRFERLVMMLGLTYYCTSTKPHINGVIRRKLLSQYDKKFLNDAIELSKKVPVLAIKYLQECQNLNIFECGIALMRIAFTQDQVLSQYLHFRFAKNLVLPSILQGLYTTISSDEALSLVEECAYKLFNQYFNCKF
jgi:hypothetical protein